MDNQGGTGGFYIVAALLDFLEQWGWGYFILFVLISFLQSNILPLAGSTNETFLLVI